MAGQQAADPVAAGQPLRDQLIVPCYLRPAPPGLRRRPARDYDEITKTCYFIFDVGEKGEKTGEVIDRLGRMAELGFEVAIGAVANVWQVTPLEVIAAEVIPAVAGL